MSDFPATVATFVGPPEMSRLTAGQHVSDAARNDLANHLDSEIIQRKAVLDNAQSELSNHIVLIEANGKVAQQNAIQSLDRRINLTLGNAIGVANEHGIIPPSPSEIRTRTAYPPPEILSAGEGKSPVPPVDSSGPYSGWSAGGKSPAEVKESGIKPSQIPVGITPGTEVLPGGYSMDKPYPIFPGPAFTPGGYSPVTGTGGPPVPQQIQNIPECPPQEPCPQVPPCPPPPDAPCDFTIWNRSCFIEGQSTCYILPRGAPPLDPQDTEGVSIGDPQGKPLCGIWEYCEQIAHTELPVCLVPVPGKPPQQIQNEPKPVPPGCCPTQPGQIINIGPQPPGSGGIIINEPPPIQQIITQPTVPFTPPSPGGQIINVPAPSQQPPQQPQAGGPAPQPPAGPEAKPPADTNICKSWDVWANQWQGMDVYELMAALGLAAIGKNSEAQAKAAGIPPWLVFIPTFIIRFFGMIFIAFAGAWLSFARTLGTGACANPNAVTLLMAMRWPITWVRRLLGFSTRLTETQLTKEENYLCPVETPEIHHANLALLRKHITPEEWRCWIRMAGMHENFGGKIYASETTWIPTVTDLVTFTARALGDADLVKRFRLTEGFDDLYKDQLAEWGEKQGISKDTMRYYFAGSRVVPSPGQVYVMLQRLRQDNIPPGVNADDWVTTPADLDRALRENHYSPFWWKRLQAISYTPLGIRQIRKAYPEGAMDAGEVEQALRDVGFSEVTARRYRIILDLERRDYLRKHDVTKLYIQTSINRQAAYDRLIVENYTDKEVNDTLAWAMREADDKSLTKCLEGIKRRFECGEFDNGDLQSELSDLRLDPEQITRLQTLWDCERKTCGKQVSASQLCSWADSGLISPQEYYQRLRNVGYNDIDARSIVAECNIKQETKVLAQRERQARQALAAAQKAADRKQSTDRRAVADARRAVRELRQLQRQAASDAAKAQRQSVNATEKANRIRATMFRQASSTAGKIRVREAMLAKAAEQWAGVAALDLPTAAQQVSQAMEAAAAIPDTPADTQIRAVLLAVLAARKAGTVDLTEAAVDLAHAMQGYASVATASVCERTNEGCESQQSNGNTVAPASTNEPRDHPGEPSSGNR